MRILQKSSKDLKLYKPSSKTLNHFAKETEYYKPSSKTLNHFAEEQQEPGQNFRRKMLKQSSSNLTNLLGSILDDKS